MTLSDFTFTDRAYPFVEIGIGDEHGISSTSQWDVARWDDPSAHWGGVEPTWMDVSCDVIRFECSCGRASTIDRFLAGTATILVDNDSGWADPSHDTIPGVLSLRPGRQIRCGVVHRTLGPVVLWRGYIDALVPVYDPVEPDTVEIHCIDALGEVNRAKAKPLAAPVGAGEPASVRIDRILDAAQWATPKRDIWATGDTLIASDLGGQTADLLGQAADSVGGVVFGDQRGTVCFRPRDWQAYDPNTPPDGSIGNSADAGAGNDVVYNQADGTHLDYVWKTDQVIFFETPGNEDVCPVRWERPFERADIATRAIIGRNAATAVQVDDVDGIVRYGIEPFERTSLLTESDARLVDLANRVLAVRDDSTAPRIRSVTMNAATGDDSLDLQATVDPFKPSRYLCRLVLERGEVFEEMDFATGWRHTIDRHSWETLINLDVAAPYANLGAHWDGAWWDRSLWAVTVVSDLVGEIRQLLDEAIHA